VSLGTGERLPISAVMEELPEDGSKSEDYDYYVTDDIIYMLGINGSISGAGRLDYQPYIWEEKIEKIYDDTGVMTGTISFWYPVLQENSSLTGIINQKIMEDVEFFYAEVLERFSEKALLNAEQMRALYHQEGQEGYEYAMSMWKDMGGYTSLQISCNMIRNNDGQFGVSYQLGDHCYAYICDLKTAKVLEGEDAVERMAEYWNAQEVLQ
ncbi:MAG: hypothetical protein K2N98_01315, partial [Lachnospiraceae bacterium]|nr:hypothetical protein [Lachnospiraceae bacterium]